MANFEANGPISGSAQQEDADLATGQTIQVTFTGQSPKGNLRWEFFDSDGASLDSGSVSLSNKPSGSIVATIDMSSYPNTGSETYNYTCSGKYDNVRVSLSVGGIKLTGSGHATATGFLSFGA